MESNPDKTADADPATNEIADVERGERQELGQEQEQEQEHEQKQEQEFATTRALSEDHILDSPVSGASSSSSSIDSSSPTRKRSRHVHFPNDPTTEITYICYEPEDHQRRRRASRRNCARLGIDTRQGQTVPQGQDDNAFEPTFSSSGPEEMSLMEDSPAHGLDANVRRRPISLPVPVRPRITPELGSVHMYYSQVAQRIVHKRQPNTEARASPEGFSLGHHDDRSPIAAALDRNDTSPTGDLIFYIAEDRPIRRSSASATTEQRRPFKPGHRRSTQTLLAVFPEPPSHTSTPHSAASNWRYPTYRPPPFSDSHIISSPSTSARQQPASKHTSDSEKRVNNLTRRLAMLNGVSPYAYDASASSSSSASTGSCAHSTMSPRQREKQSVRNTAQADPITAHYSTSKDRILAPRPITYHIYLPLQKSTHSPSRSASHSSPSSSSHSSSRSSRRSSTRSESSIIFYPKEYYQPMTIDGFDQDRDENSMTTIIEPGIAPTEPLLSLPTTSSMTPQSVSSSEPPPEPQLLPSPGPYSESPPPRLNDRSSTLSGPTAHSPPSMLNVVLAAGNDVSSHLAPSITIVSSQLVTGAPLTSRTDGVNSSSRSSSGCDSGAAAIAAGSQPARRSFRQRLKDKLSKFQKKK